MFKAVSEHHVLTPVDPMAGKGGKFAYPRSAPEIQERARRAAKNAKEHVRTKHDLEIQSLFDQVLL